jgi:hypothetical protein
MAPSTNPSGRLKRQAGGTAGPTHGHRLQRMEPALTHNTHTQATAPRAKVCRKEAAMLGNLSRTAVLVLLSTLLTAWACRRPTEPDTIIIGGDTIIIGGTPASPGATPSPGGTCGVVASVRVGFFGIGCPSGVSPRNGEGVLPLSCVGFVTATPKNAQGEEVPRAIHGPVVAWAVEVGTERVRLVSTAEEFNRNAVPEAVGDVVVAATNTPPSCGPVRGAFAFQVVAARSSSGGPIVVASSPREGDELLVYSTKGGDVRGVWRMGDPWPAWLAAMAQEIQ